MSESNGEMAQVAFEIPKETKELAKLKLDHGGLSRELRETLTRIAHGAEASELQRVKDNLETLRDERSELKQQRDSIENQLADVERKIERAEQKLDRLRDMETEYEGRLKAIEDEMHEKSMKVWPTHGKIQRLAEEYDREPEEIVSQLKERNPNLPNHQFTEGV